MANESKKYVLTLLKRLVPGTTDVRPCKNIEHCMDKRTRPCPDINALCISSYGESGRIIGGISFLFDIIVDNKENGIVLHRYGQAGAYTTLVEGNGINEIMEKLDNDEVIKDITEKTEFVRKEEADAKNFEIIEAFKRQVDDKIDDTPIILVTRKNKNGEYEELDKELIKIAKEKEEKTGNKIRIVDQSEVITKVYLLGITSKKVVRKIETESRSINDADNRVRIFVIPTRAAKKNEKAKYNGILTITSIEDDVIGINNIKDQWKKYFAEKYTGIEFIQVLELEKGTEIKNCI